MSLRKASCLPGWKQSWRNSSTPMASCGLVSAARGSRSAFRPTTGRLRCRNCPSAGFRRAFCAGADQRRRTGMVRPADGRAGATLEAGAGGNPPSGARAIARELRRRRADARCSAGTRRATSRRRPTSKSRRFCRPSLEGRPLTAKDIALGTAWCAKAPLSKCRGRRNDVDQHERTWPWARVGWVKRSPFATWIPVKISRRGSSTGTACESHF